MSTLLSAWSVLPAAIGTPATLTVRTQMPRFVRGRLAVALFIVKHY